VTIHFAFKSCIQQILNQWCKNTILACEWFTCVHRFQSIGPELIEIKFFLNHKIKLCLKIKHFFV